MRTAPSSLVALCYAFGSSYTSFLYRCLCTSYDQVVLLDYSFDVPQKLAFPVAEAGDGLLVVDVRNPEASAAPGDQKSLEVAASPSETHRPQAVHLIWDRETSSMPLPSTERL